MVSCERGDAVVDARRRGCLGLATAGPEPAAGGAVVPVGHPAAGGVDHVREVGRRQRDAVVVRARPRGGQSQVDPVGLGQVHARVPPADVAEGIGPPDVLVPRQVVDGGDDVVGGPCAHPLQHARDRLDLAVTHVPLVGHRRFAVRLVDLADGGADDGPVGTEAHRLVARLQRWACRHALRGLAPADRLRAAVEVRPRPVVQDLGRPVAVAVGAQRLDERVDRLAVAGGQRPRDGAGVADADDGQTGYADPTGVVAGPGELELHQQRRVVAELRLADQQGRVVARHRRGHRDLPGAAGQGRAPGLERGHGLRHGRGRGGHGQARPAARVLRPAVGRDGVAAVGIGAGTAVEVVGQRVREVRHRLEGGVLLGGRGVGPVEGPLSRQDRRRGLRVLAPDEVAEDPTTELGAVGLLERPQRPDPHHLPLALRGDEAGHEHAGGHDVLGRERLRRGLQQRVLRRELGRGGGGDLGDPGVHAGDVAVDHAAGLAVEALVEGREVGVAVALEAGPDVLGQGGVVGPGTRQLRQRPARHAPDGVDEEQAQPRVRVARPVPEVLGGVGEDRRHPEVGPADLDAGTRHLGLVAPVDEPAVLGLVVPVQLALVIDVRTEVVGVARRSPHRGGVEPVVHRVARRQDRGGSLGGRGLVELVGDGGTGRGQQCRGDEGGEQDRHGAARGAGGRGQQRGGHGRPAGTSRSGSWGGSRPGPRTPARDRSRPVVSVDPFSE